MAPVTIAFAAAMNPTSVDSMLRVTPSTTVSTAWDATGTLLTVRPAPTWRPGTLYTITVLPGALDATGRPLERRLRATFLTRAPVAGTFSAGQLAGAEATVATTFHLAFDGPVDAASLRVVVEPAVAGHLIPAAGASARSPAFDFVPDAPLAADVEYRVSLAQGALDADGADLATNPLVVRTAAAPAVVRFRPSNRATAVAWRQNLSVRFTEPMDRATTEKAWSAMQGKTTIAGTFNWAERDTVLVFDPKTVLGYSQSVTITIGPGATSRAGLPLKAATSATFTTAPRPVRPVRPPTGGGTTGSGGGSSGGGSSGGGTVGSGTWGAVETYYLKLMNCTRTGGSVTSTGGCSSPGGRNVAPLWQDAGISSKVSRPYARKLAVNNLCTHFSGGNPADRLKAAGYSSYIWAENLGCRSGDPYAAVLGSHLYFQAEKSTNGGHYVNLMNAKYDRAGIGVWVSGGRVRLVIDFY
ncbi:MAG: Ig-like domain-containing protein, partial [Candidatus Limnocylindrales bacterium]